MQKISSSSTYFFKRVLPMIYVGILVAGAVRSVRLHGDAWMSEMIWPVILVALAFVLFRKLFWGIADEVQVTTDALLVRKGGTEERVLLRDVLNVSVTPLTNPKVITLRLRKGGRFGDELAFISDAAVNLNPFARNAVAEDLIQRIDRARGGA